MTERPAPNSGRRLPGCLVLASLVLAILIVLLVSTSIAPIPTGCFEYCTLGRDLATFAVQLGAIAWLLAAVSTAWSRRERPSRTPALMAIGGAIVELVVAIATLRITPIVLELTLLTTGWTVGMGLLLPAIWLVVRRTAPRAALRVASGVATGAVILAAAWTVVTPGGIRADDVPPLVPLAWVVVQACTIVVAWFARRDRLLTGRAAGALIVACLPALLLPVALVAPGALGYAALSSFVLSAVAWLAIAASWVRDGPPPAGPTAPDAG